MCETITTKSQAMLFINNENDYVVKHCEKIIKGDECK